MKSRKILAAFRQLFGNSATFREVFEKIATFWELLDTFIGNFFGINRQLVAKPSNMDSSGYSNLHFDGGMVIIVYTI